MGSPRYTWSKLEGVFYEEIRHFKKALFKKDDQKNYFKKLFELYVQTEWRHLQPWDKKEFFRLWFIAVSEEYMLAFMTFEEMFKQFVEDEQQGKIGKHKDISWPADDDRADSFYNIARDVLELDIEEPQRSIWLSSQWQDNSSREDSEYMTIPSSPPAKLTNLKEIEDYKKIVYAKNRGKEDSESYIIFDSPRFGGERLLFINVQYPPKVVLHEIKKIVEEERTKYSTAYPRYASHFIKKMKNGRGDTYPFDEWERYLKMYMLKQMKIKLKEIAKHFYSERNQAPLRQVSRDCEEAEKLSRSAVAKKFPEKD